MRLRLLTTLPVAIFGGLAALFLLRLERGGDPARLPSALLGAPVPPFRLPPLEGLRGPAGAPLPGIASGDLRGAGVTVVNVWASWCAPCRVEHPHLTELGREAGLRLVGIAYKDRPENARRFLGTLGNPFAAIGVDESGRTGIDLGVYGVPETFVIGPDGTIRYKHVGPLGPETLPGFMAQVRAAARPRS